MAGGGSSDGRSVAIVQSHWWLSRESTDSWSIVERRRASSWSWPVAAPQAQLTWRMWFQPSFRYLWIVAVSSSNQRRHNGITPVGLHGLHALCNSAQAWGVEGVWRCDFLDICPIQGGQTVRILCLLSHVFKSAPIHLTDFWRGLKNIIYKCVNKDIRRPIFTPRRVCIARTMPWQDVCVSVRLSANHTPALSLNGYKYPQSFSPSGSPTILVSRTRRDVNIPTGTPLTEASNARGYEKITIFDQYRALSRNWWKIEP